VALGSAFLTKAKFLELENYSKALAHIQLPVASVTKHICQQTFGSQKLKQLFFRDSAGKSKREGAKPISDLEIAAFNGI